MRPAVLVFLAALATLPSFSPSPALAAMTADDAVKIALQKSGSIVRADANVLTARSGLWGAYSGVLPSVSADASRNGSFTHESRGTQAFGTIPSARASSITPRAVSNASAAAASNVKRGP